MLPDPERAALIAKHRDYARSLALTIAQNLPPWVVREDIVAAGTEGLVEAANRYNPTRGAQFSTFAYYRIRGAVYDYVRKLASNDPYLRSRMSASAAVDDLVESTLAAQTQTRAPKAEPADAAQALASVLDSAARAFTVIDCAEALVSQASRGAATSEDDASRSETAATVRRAIDALPAKERTMIDKVYFEGRTIEEAGATLGLSKSWSSRLHARALEILYEEIAPQEDELQRQDE
jgi:RNA polymerase sigma factor for flagellar operon FliA